MKKAGRPVMDQPGLSTLGDAVTEANPPRLLANASGLDLVAVFQQHRCGCRVGNGNVVIAGQFTH